MRGSKSRIACRIARARSVASSEVAVLPGERRQPEIDDGPARERRLRQVGVRVEPRGVEQPRQVAQDRLPEAAPRQQARLSRFELLVRLVVGQPIEQRRLQPFVRRKGVSHPSTRPLLTTHTPRHPRQPRRIRTGVSRCLNASVVTVLPLPTAIEFSRSRADRLRSWPRGSARWSARPSAESSSTSVVRIRCPRPWCTSAAASDQSVLRAIAIVPSPAASEPAYRVGMSATDSPPFSNSQVRRHPHDVPQILGRLEHDLGQPRERDPVVAAVDHRLEHRPEARVGVGDPVERTRRRSSPLVVGASSNARDRSSFDCSRSP